MMTRRLLWAALLLFASLASASGQLIVSPAVLNLPITPVGTTSIPQMVALSNTGTTTQNIVSRSATGQFVIDNADSTCGSNLAAGDVCLIAVEAVPTTAGAFSGTLSVQIEGSSTQLTVALNSTTLLSDSSTTVLTSTGSAAPYTLTATVTGSSGAAVPSGTVNFTDTTAYLQLGTAPVGNAKSVFSLNVESPMPLGPPPSSIAAGDLNGDGKIDVVLADGGESACTSGCPTQLTVMLNQGNGAFLNSLVNIGTTPGFVAITDVNSDGKQDIVELSASGLVVLLGKGDGTFTQLTTQSVYPSGVDVGPLVVGDFNGDGKVDLAAILYTGVGTPAYVLTGNGDGTFTNTLKALTPTGNAISLISADFNGDGRPDLAIASADASGSGASYIDVFLNGGSATFTKQAGGFSSLTDGAIASIAAGDLNGDGNVDLVASFDQNTSSTAAVLVLPLLGDGTGEFTSGTAITAAQNGSGSGVLIADFNGDGKADVALTDYTMFSVYPGNGDGTFGTPVSVTGPGTNPESESLVPVAADFNSDGLPDIAIADSDLGLVHLLLSQETSTVTATLANISAPGSKGMHQAQAVYSGDTNYVSSISNSVGLGVILVATKLTLSSTASSLTFGTQVALQAILAPSTAMGLSTDGESVTFSSDGTNLGTAKLSGGVATLDVTSLPIGTDSVTTTYAGDANFAAATSAVTTITVTSPAVASLSPTSLTFTTTPVGSTASAQKITLTNSGGSAMMINAIAATGDFAQTNTCGTSVAAGANCAITVTFTPTVAGNRTGAVTVTDNATGSPQSVALTGTGLAGPTAAFSPTSLTFTTPQAQGTTATAQTITLTNSGGAAMTITTIAATGDFAQTNTCGTSVAAGANCTISVTFKPTATGSRTGSLTVTDNATGSPQTVALSGTGSGFTVASSSPSLTISSGGGSVTTTLTITGVSGFAGTAGLTCVVGYGGSTTLVNPPTCSLSPTSVTIGSSPVTAVLTVTSPSKAGTKTSGVWAGAAAVLGCLLFGTLRPLRRRRLPALALVLLCLAPFAGIAGCGGSGGSSGANLALPTTTGAYTVTLTVASGSTLVSTSIPVTVQ